MLVGFIESRSGLPVEIDGISVGFRGGIGASIDGLKIFQDGSRQRTLLEVNKGSALFQIEDLLRGKLRFGKIILDSPVINIPQDDLKSKQEKLQPVTRSEAVSSPTSDPGSMQMLSYLSVESIHVKNGRLSIPVRVEGADKEIRIEGINAAILDISILRAVPFELTAALFSKTSNIRLTGTIQYHTSNGDLDLRDVKASLDLSPSIIQGLRELVSPQDVPNASIAGDVNLVLDPLSFGVADIPSYTARIDLRGGIFEFKDEGLRVDGLNAKAVVSPELISIETVKGKLMQGDFSASGSIRTWQASPSLEFNALIQNLLLDSITGGPGVREPYLSGLLSGRVELQGSAADWNGLAESVRGKGVMKIDKPRLVNMNLMKEIFNKISILPGLSKTLLERLPPDYSEKFKSDMTEFYPIEFPFNLQNGQIVWNNINLAAEDFQVASSGYVKFLGEYQSISSVFIEPNLSKAMVRSIQELQYLLTPEGWMMIPFTVQGRPPGQPQILPDVGSIASKLAVQKTKEILGRWIGKTKSTAGAEQPTQGEVGQSSSRTSPNSETSDQPLTVENIVGLFLGSGQSQESSEKR